MKKRRNSETWPTPLEDPRPISGRSVRRRTAVAELLDWLKYIIAAIVIGILLVLFVIQRNSVVGPSMISTLHDGDQLMVEKVSKLWHGIGRGDIITVYAEGLPNHDGPINIIKRCVGVPGDEIEIKENAVFLNGVRLEEPYTRLVMPDGSLGSPRPTLPQNPRFNRVKLGLDEYYVLGDNRTSSLDSRTIGPIPEERIIGKVLFRFYPLDRIGLP